MLTIITGENNKILRTVSKPIEKANSRIKKLAGQMKESMESANGLGIAAPQVGVNERIIIVRLNSGTKHEQIVALINPEIITFSEESEVAEEGCLSLPNVYVPVERSKKITLKYQTTKNDNHTIELEDLNARVVQHEVDHLDGILIVDKIKK